jgi:hypothetical protein
MASGVCVYVCVCVCVRVCVFVFRVCAHALSHARQTHHTNYHIARPAADALKHPNHSRAVVAAGTVPERVAATYLGQSVGVLQPCRRCAQSRRSQSRRYHQCQGLSSPQPDHAPKARMLHPHRRHSPCHRRAQVSCPRPNHLPRLRARQQLRCQPQRAAQTSQVRVRCPTQRPRHSFCFHLECFHP